jgi:hypothetical protein
VLVVLVDQVVLEVIQEEVVVVMVALVGLQIH